MLIAAPASSLDSCLTSSFPCSRSPALVSALSTAGKLPCLWNNTAHKHGSAHSPQRADLHEKQEKTAPVQPPVLSPLKPPTFFGLFCSEEVVRSHGIVFFAMEKRTKPQYHHGKFSLWTIKKGF